MKIITEIECENWVKKTFDLFPSELYSKLNLFLTCIIPSDAHQKTVLSRSLCHTLSPRPEGLLWITDYGVYESAQNLNLFFGYRKYLGEYRSINDAPGHIFSISDLDITECLVDIILYFYWDAAVINGFNGSIVEISHNESITIRTNDTSELDKYKEMFTNMELKILK